VLQAQVALRRKGERRAREVGDWLPAITLGRRLDQLTVGEEIGHARHRRRICRYAWRIRYGGSVRQARIEQPMRGVERRPQDLAAGKVLEGRRDAAADLHAPGVDRLGWAETRQGGAIGAHEKNRFDQVAAGLLDGKRRKLTIVK